MLALIYYDRKVIHFHLSTYMEKPLEMPHETQGLISQLLCPNRNIWICSLRTMCHWNMQLSRSRLLLGDGIPKTPRVVRSDLQRSGNSRLAFTWTLMTLSFAWSCALGNLMVVTSICLTLTSALSTSCFTFFYLSNRFSYQAGDIVIFRSPYLFHAIGPWTPGPMMPGDACMPGRVSWVHFTHALVHHKLVDKPAGFFLSRGKFDEGSP